MHWNTFPKSCFGSQRLPEKDCLTSVWGRSSTHCYIVKADLSNALEAGCDGSRGGRHCCSKCATARQGKISLHRPCLMTEAHLTQPLVVKSKALSSGVCWPHASQGDSRVGNACAHGIYHDTSSSDEDELEGSINAVRDITDPAVTLGPHNFPTNFEADIIVMLKGRGTRQ